MISLLALAVAAGPAVAAPCVDKTRAAVAFTDDSDADARAAVETELLRACFAVDDVDFASEPEMFAAAGRAPWLLIVKATLSDASVSASKLPHTTMPTYTLSVDLTAFDVQSGQRRGRALRSANLVATTAKPTAAREAVRVVGDAVRVLRDQLEEPAPVIVEVAAPTAPAAGAKPCASERRIVVLWHKAADVDGRAQVTKALAQRCFVIAEQIEGERNMAMEFARDMELPLLAVKTTIAQPAAGGGVVSHVLSVTVDLVDAKAESLKILARASESGNALRAGNEAEAWAKVDAGVVGKALDKVLPQ